MLPAARRLLCYLALAAGTGAEGAGAQIRPSRRPASLPPIPAAEGPLAIHVVYPPEGAQLTARDSGFVFGSVGSGRAVLAINGLAVPVAPNGAFLAWLPLPDDSIAALHLVARKDGDSAALDRLVQLPRRFVPPGSGALWLDRGSLEPRGNRWAEPGEPIRVWLRAAPGAQVSLRLPDGREIPLAPDTTFAAESGPFDRRAPVVPAPDRARYAGVFPAAQLGAPLPSVTTPVVPRAPADSLSAATLMVRRGADTLRVALPLRLTLLEPAQRPVVVLSEDTARSGSGVAVGMPMPGGPYHWLFPNGTPALVTGRADELLRVRLSRGTVAWVFLSEIASTRPAGTPPPEARVALVRLRPGDSSIAARVSLSARVPFRVDEDDRHVILRLYGARSDLDWVQYGGTDPLIRRITWAQPVEDEVTVDFELGVPVFGWRPRWDGSDLVIEIRRPPAIHRAHPLRGRTIAVDPGHPPLGATGPTGLREAEANLAVALKLRDLLAAQGARVLMTRSADTALGLYQRTGAAERAGAEILVSIHNNAFPDGVNPFENNGTSVYYYHPRSARLAALVQQALVGEMGLRNLGFGRGDLALVRPTWMPAVLTEGAFLMIPEQENALRTPSFEKAYARGVALGIQAYLLEIATPP